MREREDNFKEFAQFMSNVRISTLDQNKTNCIYSRSLKKRKEQWTKLVMESKAKNLKMNSSIETRFP